VVVITAILISAPWLVALVWVLCRFGTGLHGSEPPSMAEEARRRLAVR
jgi:hypothetical protein